MQLIRHLPSTSDRPTAVAIGNFDGLHLGHQAVIAAMAGAAQAQDLVPSVLTFEPHPRRFFAPTTPAFRIERLATKLRRLRDDRVARVYMPPFNAQFSALTAEAFLQDVLKRRLGARVVVTGENFAFGKDRGGDIRTLRAWGEKEGVEIIAVPPVKLGEAICSSSAIRAALANGDVTAARHLLGRPYSVTGRIVHGDGRGKGIGFPTLNIAQPPGMKPMAYGVYAVRVRIGEERDAQVPSAARHFEGVANFGVKPTVSVDNRPVLEVHLFDVMQDFYGRQAEVVFVDYLRPETKFDGMDALVAQIRLDCKQAKQRLAKGD